MVLHEERFLISVVVPVFNVAKYLQRCVDSILSQTFQNFELILVDDGSTDGSSEICDEYADKDSRVRAIHYINSGVSVARNNGIKAARGEYISFVDADDWVEEGFLGAFADEIVRSAADGTMVDMVVQGYWNHEGKVMQWPLSHYQNAQDFCSHLYEMQERKLIGYVWNKVFCRSIIDEYKLAFNPSIPIGEDFIFCMEFLSHATVLDVSPYAGYHYCFSGDKEYSFAALNRRVDAFYDVLPTLKNLPSEVAASFRLDEFRFSLYIIHILYKEELTRNVRIAFLRKIRYRICHDEHPSILSLKHPYIWLALMVIYLPVAFSDAFFHIILFRKTDKNEGCQ